MLRFLLPIAMAVGVSACSSGASSDDAKAEAQAAAAQKTVLDPQLKALQKAKDVQKTIDADKKATDKAIDDGGG
jgi:uncharacterized protein YdaU (DUF1376 family)